MFCKHKSQISEGYSKFAKVKRYINFFQIIKDIEFFILNKICGLRRPFTVP